MKSTKPLNLATLLVLALTLTSTTSFAADKLATIEPVYPAGSTTYFLVLTVWSDGVLDTELLPATLKTVRMVQQALRNSDQASAPEPASRTLPDPNTPDEPEPSGPRIATVRLIQHFTLTIWSDGKLDQTQPIETAPSDVAKILTRLQEQTDEPQKERKLQVTPPPTKRTAGPPTSYRPGDTCHAKTTTGARCTRVAKETTGFCWQHQGQHDVYPGR